MVLVLTAILLLFLMWLGMPLMSRKREEDSAPQMRKPLKYSLSPVRMATEHPNTYRLVRVRGSPNCYQAII
jgi:hypothetical protein